MKMKWPLVVSIFGLVFGVGAVKSQDTAGSDDGVVQEEEFEEPEFFEFDAPSEIEELLSEEWRVLAGESQPSYDPGTRRDPFQSLIVERTSVVSTGQRPEGLPGLLIGDLEVTGIMAFGAERVAQVRAADRSVSYLVHEGDRLFDGDVISISSEEVVFQQVVDDPAALRPFRTVVKKLRPEN